MTTQSACSRFYRIGLLCMVMLAAAACATPAPTPAAGRSAAPAAAGQSASQPNQTLVMILRDEPGSLTMKLRVGLTLTDAKRLFTAGLAIPDEVQTPQPQLAEALPQLNTDSWRVFPDGRMETTYKLRPNLTWHDGTPLTVEDFIFAQRVYTNPGELPLLTQTPQNQIDEIVAVDARTMLIRWKRPYPDAGSLREEFPPLPRHILEQPFLNDPEGFPNHSYWAREYVQLGPYRVDHWEPGSAIEGAAFAGYALGRPKIDRIRLIFVADPNTVIANLLSGTSHMLLDHSAFRTGQGKILEQQWGTRNEGIVLYEPTSLRTVQIQLRPEWVQPRAILDLRTRQALAHSVDREAITDATFEGKGAVLDALVSQFTTYREAAERAVTKYPYDLRRADQLLNEVGYTKGADGFYTHPTDGRFSMEVRASASTQNEQDLVVMANGWQRAGIDATANPFAVARLSDGQFRTSFPALQLDMGTLDETFFRSKLHTSSTPRADNRWTGSNRGGWVSAEFDRLVEVFETTLDRRERDQQVVQLATLVSEQVPILTIYYDFLIRAHLATLEGPKLGGGSWNIQEWRWR